MFFSVSSCNASGDQRLWIYEGSCDELNQIAASDDDCGLNVSINQLRLNMGDTIYLEWDDRWNDEGFEFTINYDLGEFPNFTCSSIELDDNGIYKTISPIGPCHNCPEGSDFNSIWYHFIPPTNGTLSVSSCGHGVDTNLSIYDYSFTGNGSKCDTLTLIANPFDNCDMGCSGSSPDFAEQATICVNSLDTILIEWDNRFRSFSCTSGNDVFEFDFTFTPSSCSR